MNVCNEVVWIGAVVQDNGFFFFLNGILNFLIRIDCVQYSYVMELLLLSQNILI